MKNELAHERFDHIDNAFADAVKAGLSAEPKTLSCKYFYDGVGSALFDAITYLQEYGCARGEKRLLSQHSRSILQTAGSRPHVVELGGGTGDKALLLLSAASQKTVRYHNVDISEMAVNQSANVLKGFANVRFHGHVADFNVGLEQAAKMRMVLEERVLVLFLGSSIGNFSAVDSVEFLQQVRGRLRSGDLLLLGTDLVKPPDRLIAAYDDPQGVTAAFNKNLLARINHELGGNFDLTKFAHEARWNEDRECVEMLLRSLADQTVRISKAQLICRVADGETILSERSHKYRAENIGDWLQSAGWSLLEQWIDVESQFALNLAKAS